MRTSVRFLAAAALCLGTASSVHAQGIQYTPFTSNNTPIQYSPFSAGGTQIQQPFAPGTTSGSSSSSQATFPPPGASFAGPSRLINLMPNLHSLSNTHYIGYSMFPSQTDQYLAQFGFKRLR